MTQYQYRDHTITEAEHAHWMEMVIDNPNKAYWVVFDDERPIGVAGINKITQKHKRGLYDPYIGDTEYLGKGVGRWMTQRTLEAAFGGLGLQKMTVEVFADNEAGLKMYQRNGFRSEGTIRQHIYKNGEPKDVIFMGVLKSEYDAANG